MTSNLSKVLLVSLISFCTLLQLSYNYNMTLIRYLILTLACLACAVDFINRTNINVAIVSMVETNNETSKQFGFCPKSASNSSSDSPTGKGPRYNWSQTEQGIVLGAFYLPYILLQVPVGRLTEVYGARWPISVRR